MRLLRNFQKPNQRSLQYLLVSELNYIPKRKSMKKKH